LFFSSLPNDFLQSVVRERIKDLAQSNIHCVVLSGKYDQPCQGTSFLEMLPSLSFQYVHTIQKDECIVLKKDSDALQIAALPYKKMSPSDATSLSSRSEIAENRISKLIPKIQPDLFSVLFMQATLSFLEPFFLLPDIPAFHASYLQSLPFQYFAFGGQPFKKIEKLSTLESWIGYPGSLGEFEYADSTIERGFLVYDSLSISEPPHFIPNPEQRLTALIRISANSEKEIMEKLNEEFLLNDYREHITRIVLHTDANLSLPSIHGSFEEHCFHIHSIEQQGKQLRYVDDEEILPIRRYVDFYLEEKRLPLPEILEEEVNTHCLSYLYNELPE
ncbi:MAG: hypothetical protein PHI40_05240, partial [Caldisericia bacterium]|nr:hypothetical protein [Caldisericia bacterium]